MFAGKVFENWELIWCANIPECWPGWVGGNEDFIKQGQPFYEMIDLRHATMLEF